MIRKDYILWAYMTLYSLIGWQYIILKIIDSTTPTRFIDKISSSAMIAGVYFLTASIFIAVAIARGVILAGIVNSINKISGTFGKVDNKCVGKFLLVPQLLIALSSVVSMSIAVIDGQYADGTVLSWHFILKDQYWTVPFTIFNFLSVIKYE